MPLNLSPEEIGKNTAHGITAVRELLNKNLELEINARQRVASISDPLRRHWTALTLDIRDCIVSKLPTGLEDEDEIMSAFFADLGNDRMYDIQTAAEIIMHYEGRIAEMILERYYSTDCLWLYNRVRNVVDRFMASQPTTDRTNGLGIIPPEPGCGNEFGLGEAGVTLKDPLLNQIVGWAHIACAPEVPVIFSPEEDPPESPIILHKLLKSGELTQLAKICDFGISRDCQNRMDHLLTFPLGNTIVYFSSCSNCCVELLDFIDEPERDENGDLIILEEIEA